MKFLKPREYFVYSEVLEVHSRGKRTVDGQKDFYEETE